MNAVRHSAMTCLHHWLKPSVYPRGMLNIYSVHLQLRQQYSPTLILAKKSFYTQ